MSEQPVVPRVDASVDASVGTSAQPGEEVRSVAESRVSIRRAPKLPIFLILGGGFGAVVTFILTASFEADPLVGFGASLGYFMLYGVPAGVVLGTIVGLALDRRSRRRAREVTVQHESVQQPEQAEVIEPAAATEAQPDEPSNGAQQA